MQLQEWICVVVCAIWFWSSFFYFNGFHTFVIWSSSIRTADLTRNVRAGEGTGQVNINPDKSAVTDWNFDRIMGTDEQTTPQYTVDQQRMGSTHTLTHTQRQTDRQTDITGQTKTHTQKTVSQRLKRIKFVSNIDVIQPSDISVALSQDDSCTVLEVSEKQFLRFKRSPLPSSNAVDADDVMLFHHSFLDFPERSRRYLLLMLAFFKNTFISVLLIFWHLRYLWSLKLLIFIIIFHLWILLNGERTKVVSLYEQKLIEKIPSSSLFKDICVSLSHSWNHSLQ